MNQSEAKDFLEKEVGYNLCDIPEQSVLVSLDMTDGTLTTQGNNISPVQMVLLTCKMIATLSSQVNLSIDGTMELLHDTLDEPLTKSLLGNGHLVEVDID